MKVRITRTKNDELTELAEDLLLEPDPNDPENYLRVKRDVWVQLVRKAQELFEENDEVKAYCNKHDYYQLKDILIKLNALSMASKGNLLKGQK